MDIEISVNESSPVKTTDNCIFFAHYDVQDAVYEVCRRTCDDGSDGTDIFPDQLDLIADK